MTTRDGEEQVQTAIRLPQSLLVRLDKLAERMSQPGMKITRTEVLRLGLFRGVELLEAEGAKKR